MTENISPSKLLTLLSNELRYNILKLLYTEPKPFNDILKYLSVDSTSKLSFHLNKMDQLIFKRDNGVYEVNELGQKAYDLISSFESHQLENQSILDSFETIVEETEDLSDLVSDIYISKAYQDNTIGETLTHMLEDQGFRCVFFPRDLPVESNYFDEIRKIIPN